MVALFVKPPREAVQESSRRDDSDGCSVNGVNANDFWDEVYTSLIWMDSKKQE